jgi:hypothetical protein
MSALDQALSDRTTATGIYSIRRIKMWRIATCHIIGLALGVLICHAYGTAVKT